NLIQAYANNNNTALWQYNSDKVRKDFDINKELTNHTFIKPLPGNGTLVKNSIFDTPSELFKDYKYSLKAFRHAWNGKANDHELGVINDLGMKLGGIAIAAYLFSRNHTPKTKIMEFIGFASFFAAMDIWPKIALQWPAQLIHGFNVRQKYRDNSNTKKRVFQDHQFIPWDLYSDEEINKIGDRMNVPKDMKNRREFIQEKMRKIALQNNTMWMLTSGFATPIMSALICNILAKPIEQIQHNRRTAKADALLENFPVEIAKHKYEENTEVLTQILEENKGKPLNTELIKRISAQLSDGIDDGTAKSIYFDIKNIAGPEESYTIDRNTTDALVDLYKKEFSSLNLPKKNLEQLVPNKNLMAKIFEDNGLLRSGVSDFTTHIRIIQNIILDNAAKIYQPANIERKRIEFILDKSITPKSLHGDSKVKQILKAQKSNILTEELSDRIIKISETLNGFRARLYVLDKYAYLKAAQAPETILANVWNNTADSMAKIFDIKPEEIKETRYDRKLVTKLLKEKFENIASNDETYERVVKELSSKLATLQLETDFGDREKVFNEKNHPYRSHVVQTFNSTADSLEKLNMPTVARRLVGYDRDKDTTSLKNIQLEFLTDRIKGVRTSFYQLLNTLDTFRRIHKNNIGETEEAQFAKRLLIEGHTSDYATKFFIQRNPDKTKNIPTEEYIDFSNDSNFFKRVMNLMFGDNLAEETTLKIQDSYVYNPMKKYRQEMYEIFGDEFYFAKPHHVINKNGRKATSEEKFIQKGCSIDNMFLDLFKNKYNSGKWLKTFGKLGAIILGITLISQFFMGRMKTNKETK
ncbi:hypothetical protein IJ596_02840, partial [bacterium]|nr:hypothetical protein [bacterium]